MFKTALAVICITILFSSELATGGKAPDFTLNRLDGEKFTLSEQLKNGPVLIDFWATWCKPCLRALPSIQHLHELYAEKGLQVVTISTDSPKSQSKIKPFIKGSDYSFEVLLDTDQEVRSLFGGSVIPFTALINSDGEIVYNHLGYKPGDENLLEEAVKRVLDAEAANTPAKESAEPGEQAK